MQRTIRRGVALATTAIVITSGFAAGAGSALAGSHWSSVDRAAVAAGYLARHLAGPNHDHITVKFGGDTFDDYGTTADVVLSMDAAGAAQRAAKRATAFLAQHVTDYVGAPPAVYPGAAAKLVLVALAQHRDPHSFGGVDLVDAIVQTEGAGGAEPGEYQQNPVPDPSFPPVSFTVSQALPVLALALATGAVGQPDDAAVSFLASQQCDNGAFPSEMRSDPNDDCGDNDVDSTGYAVQALLAVGAKTDAAEALTWLESARNSDGGYGLGPSNANSTALAVQALVAGHSSARSGLRWLRQHQVGCEAKAGRRGAVIYQKKYDGSAVRATSQAAAALARKPLAWIDRTGARATAPTLDC